MIVIQNMYRTLFKLDEEGKLVKDLCEDYKVSEDGKTYTFTIKDAKWSDGEAVKADDLFTVSSEDFLTVLRILIMHRMEENTLSERKRLMKRI